VDGIHRQANHSSSSFVKPAFSKIQAVAQVRHYPRWGEITHHALRHQDFDRLMSGFSKPYQLPENRFWKIDRDSLRGHANP
jgi:hypothetical protein